MTYEFQQRQAYYAQIPGGLEAEGAGELESLGATAVRPTHRGAAFHADLPTLYRVCFRARLAARVLAPLLSFECRSPEAIYRWAREVAFGDFMSASDRFALQANVSGSWITHSQYAALKVKDAIVDQFKERVGSRPTVDRREPDVAFHLHVAGTRATLSLDASGGAMHRRHYRSSTVKAPMQENLAAAIVDLSGWDGSVPLYDPFCGSGTLLAEALMSYCRVPALVLRRRFGFERLPGFDSSVWRQVRRDAMAGIRQLPADLIAGSDIDREAVGATRRNLELLPGGCRVRVEVADFRNLGGLGGRTIVTNPPYGIRLRDEPNVQALYRDLGDFLKRRCPGAVAHVYVGDRALLKHIGLRSTSRRALVNGALDGRLCRFDLFTGRWRASRSG